LLHAISFLERRLIADRHVDVGGCQVGALLYMETVLARLFPVLESEKLHRLSLVQKSIHRCGRPPTEQNCHRRPEDSPELQCQRLRCCAERPAGLYQLFRRARFPFVGLARPAVLET
jgi:hypothetical protein